MGRFGSYIIISLLAFVFASTAYAQSGTVNARTQSGDDGTKIGHVSDALKIYCEGGCSGGGGGGLVQIDQTTPGTTNGVVINNTSLAVTGAFYQATQPISGAISFTAPQHVILDTTPIAVTGTFYQATQPVSGAISFTAPQHVILDSGALTSGSVTVTNSFALDATLVSTNSKLDTVNTNLGTINTSIGATNTALGTVNTNLGTLHSDLGTINTSIGTGNTTLSSIDTDIKSTQPRKGPPDSVTSATLSASDSGTCTTTTTGCVVVPLSGYGGVGISVTFSSGTGTMRIEGSSDGGVNYGTSIQVYNYSSGLVVAGALTQTTCTSECMVTPINVAGLDHIRVRASSCSSCSIPVTMTLTTASIVNTKGSESNGTIPTLSTIVSGKSSATPSTSLIPYVATTTPGASDPGWVVRPVNIVTAPLFTTLSDGTNPFGTTSNPIYTLPGTGANVSLETGGNLASIVTNTTGLALHSDITPLALESGGNLASIKTNTTGLALESGGNISTMVTQGDVDRRIQEASYIEQTKTTIDTIIEGESYASQRMGYEIR